MNASVIELHPGQDAGPDRRDRGRRISVVEGVCHAVMLGAGECYLAALAVELGHRETALALLLTVPLLVGALAQLLAGPLTAVVGGRKRLVVIGASVQAAMHVGFVVLAATHTTSLLPLLLTKTCYWIAGSVIGPPWAAWMASLTEGAARERYFALRSTANQVAILLSFSAAGIFLHRQESHGSTALGAFALLNLVALGARTMSALSFTLQPDVSGSTVRSQRASLDAIRDALRTSDWRTAIYVALFMFGAHIAVPFFTPYMLNVLKYDYATYAGLTAVPFLTKVFAMAVIYPAAVRFGMRAVLATATAFIAAVALGWSVTTSLEGILIAQAMSGIAWAAFEYASFQVLLESSRPHCRVEFLSLANALAGVAQLAGALLGATLLSRFLFDHQQIFLTSAVGRLLPLLVIAVLVPKAFTHLSRLWFRVVSILPAGGALMRPIVHNQSRLSLPRLVTEPSDTPVSPAADEERAEGEPERERSERSRGFSGPSPLEEYGRGSCGSR